jgi:hypothetical protein
MGKRNRKGESMTTRKKTGTTGKGSKKLNVKRKTLKDLVPSSGKDAKGGRGGCTIVIATDRCSRKCDPTYP